MAAVETPPPMFNIDCATVVGAIDRLPSCRKMGRFASVSNVKEGGKGVMKTAILLGMVNKACCRKSV